MKHITSGVGSPHKKRAAATAYASLQPRLNRALYVITMKRLLIIFSILSVSAHGEVWGPQDLKFKLEDRSNIEAMIWLSGFSYSSTALYKSCGAIGSKESISSKLFVDLLNSKYTGATISAEQATAHISSYLGKEYVCKNI